MIMKVDSHLKIHDVSEHFQYFNTILMEVPEIFCILSIH